MNYEGKVNPFGLFLGAFFIKKSFGIRSPFGSKHPRRLRGQGESEKPTRAEPEREVRQEGRPGRSCHPEGRKSDLPGQICQSANCGYPSLPPADSSGMKKRWKLRRGRRAIRRKSVARQTREAETSNFRGKDRAPSAITSPTIFRPRPTFGNINPSGGIDLHFDEYPLPGKEGGWEGRTCENGEVCSVIYGSGNAASPESGGKNANKAAVTSSTETV